MCYLYLVNANSSCRINHGFTNSISSYMVWRLIELWTYVLFFMNQIVLTDNTGVKMSFLRWLKVYINYWHLQNDSVKMYRYRYIFFNLFLYWLIILLYTWVHYGSHECNMHLFLYFLINLSLYYQPFPKYWLTTNLNAVSQQLLIKRSFINAIYICFKVSD